MALMPPNAAELRASLCFQRRTDSVNIGGVVKDTWDRLMDDRRAKVMPRLGGEAVMAGRMTGKVDYDIWVRSDTETRTLTNADRAVNNRTGEVYNLGQPIDPFGTRCWLLIQAVSAGNAEGNG